MSDHQANAEVWTIGRLLNWTTDFLKSKGADSPRLDAEVLLAHSRKCQRIELYTAFEEEAPETLRNDFRALVQRRAKGTPVAYLVGQREFFSLSFEVTPDVLIPRPETEDLVVRALDLAKEMKSAEPLAILDVGTGSGAIAVSVAKHCRNCQVTAIDVSAAALSVARRNAERHQMAEKIDFLESDLWERVPAEARFHLVLTNPPYVASEEMKTLAVDVREHEPHLALDGGQGGTEVISRLLEQLATYLQPGGWLLMEVGTNATLVEQLVEQTVGMRREETIKDTAGLSRVVQAMRVP